MTTNDIVKQLRACESTFPVPKFSTRHLRIAPNPLMVAFVRMAGESRPWGIVFGRKEDGQPRVITAGDGRNREEVSRICEEFAGALFTYFRAEGHTFSPITKDNIDSAELPQIWVPGDRHVEMFHHLEYAFWRVRKGDSRTNPLTVLARLSGWIFRFSNHRGQQIIVDASRALRDHYTFPCDNQSLGNLTNAIAWFQENGTLNEKRVKVRERGLQRMSPTLDPNLDSKVLAPLLAERAELIDQNKSIDVINRKIHDVLEPELLSRWQAMQDAYEILCNDTRRENAGVEKLVKNTLQDYVRNFQYREREIIDEDGTPAYTPHPETDFHGSAAASNYFQMAAADNAYTALLVHDDEELQAASIVTGHSFVANVIEVENRGFGRTTTPVWTLEVEITELLRLREGERYALLGNTNSSLVVRDISPISDTKWSVEVEWLTPKTKDVSGSITARPIDPAWVGQRVLLVPSDGSAMDSKKSRAVWEAKNGIGSWLTHGRAPRQVVDNVVDDITQLQGS